MSRLVDGDESGAVTSACGAVDVVTQNIYEREGLGDPGRASFSTKVNTSFAHLQTGENLKAELIDLGINPDDAAAV